MRTSFEEIISRPRRLLNSPMWSGLTENARAYSEKVPSASHPSEKPSIDVGDIIKTWKRMAAALPKGQANLSALMNSVRLIDIQHGTLILGLASDVLVSKLDKPDQIETIQKLIHDEFGVEMPVRCIVTTSKGKIPPNVPQDGMVATAIQHGGEIVVCNTISLCSLFSVNERIEMEYK